MVLLPKTALGFLLALCLSPALTLPAQPSPFAPTKPALSGSATAAGSVTAAGSALPAISATADQRYSLPPAKLAQAIRLHRARVALYFASTAWGLLFLYLLLATRAAASMGEFASHVSSRSWLKDLAFCPLLLLIFSLAMLPFELAGHHLSLAYGLSIEAWPAWLWDWTKSLLITLLVGSLLLIFLMATVRRSPRRWWLWFWIASLPLTVLAVYIVPVMVDPLFNHFEPLAKTHPQLVSELERVVARTGTDIPPERMFLMKASDKLTVVNAYVTGIGSSKRVVIWDTTIDKTPTDEILFTFGHESGHYVLNHIWKGLAFGALLSFIFLWMGSRISLWLLERCGSRWNIERLQDPAAVCILLLVFLGCNFLAEPLANSFSRYQEHQADVYGQEAIHSIVADARETTVRSFERDGEIYLDDPDPSQFIEFWTYSHPSTQHRTRFAAGYDPWAPGNHPLYFQGAAAQP